MQKCRPRLGGHGWSPWVSFQISGDSSTWKQIRSCVRCLGSWRSKKKQPAPEAGRLIETLKRGDCSAMLWKRSRHVSACNRRSCWSDVRGTKQASAQKSPPLRDALWNVGPAPALRPPVWLCLHHSHRNLTVYSISIYLLSDPQYNVRPTRVRTLLNSHDLSQHWPQGRPSINMGWKIKE